MAERPDLVPPSPNDVPGLDGPGFGSEGLHMVRFTVKADGSTDDVEVVGGFTNPQAKQFLQQMVNEWTFTAGTANGEPVDFYNQEYVVRNRLANVPPITPVVEEQLNAVNALVVEGNLDKAQKDIKKLIKNKLITALDYVVAHEILSAVYMAMNQPYEALAANQIASMSRVNSAGHTEYLLPPPMLELALRKRILLASNLHQTAEAVRTFEMLEQAFEIAADDPIRKQAETFSTALQAAEPLILSAKIIEEQWTYQPARRIFTVANVEGSLKKINIRCQRGNVELDYQENVDWTIPDRLGNCTLDFIGKDGTRFNVYEFSQ